MNRSELILLGITAIWGFTFPAMKASLDYLPPILFLAYRFGIASLLMLIIFRSRVLKRETLKEGFVLGLTLFFGHGFQIVGLKYTTASNSAFITSLYVVFTPFIAYFILGDRLGGRDVLSLIMALTGLYLISGASLNFNYGDLLTVLCAISFAFQIVLVQRFEKKDYLSLAFWQILWNFVFSLAFALLFESLVVPRDPMPWMGILYTAIFATVVAFTLQVKYQRDTKAHRAALIYSAEPIFGHIAAFLTIGEILSPKGYLGAALIMAGIWNEVRKEA
ncbi:permease [Thermococcus onnurineus NA1]|uniref:Permease n=1 Tax=Thermococcus onnurineus (strain NA1) TaxID=523850 RepID=B6YVH1_THEON|nr:MULTISPECIES: DMT family transporter [Thermococcus]ACJ17295.1 permease [Thermococcus onnurineus NA1]NJE45958.1 DMT family transporter [Thermococcus sp. GR7]NJE78451.1 DMT family transporter [Thermococcus sp. GR4]NJF22154.1 DMT family transporter [Thermococcus sp. GR5]